MSTWRTCPPNKETSVVASGGSPLGQREGMPSSVGPARGQGKDLPNQTLTEAGSAPGAFERLPLIMKCGTGLRARLASAISVTLDQALQGQAIPACGSETGAGLSVLQL